MKMNANHQQIQKSTRPQQQSAAMTSYAPTATYSMTKSSNGNGNGNGNGGIETLTRYRTPSHADVLCGRGGGINAHAGNVTFRDMIKEEKERYSLARNKAAKSEIAEMVIGQVHGRGGRFLQRENKKESGSLIPGIAGWWVEVDHEKAIAKTCQALREGAPVIRAQAARSHDDDVDLGRGKRRRKRPGSSGSRSRSRSRPQRKRRTVRRSYRDDDDTEDELMSVSEQTQPQPPKAKEEAKKEEAVHPLIRGFADGHRGKQLIPVFRGKTTPTVSSQSADANDNVPETKKYKGSPQSQSQSRGPDSTRASECPTPPPHQADSVNHVTSTILSIPSLGDEPNHEYVSFAWGVTGGNGGSEEAKTDAEPEPPKEILSVLEPTDLNDIVKPDIGCVRVPSLTPSEWGIHSANGVSPDEDEDNPDAFRGDEPFQNPFVNSSDDNHTHVSQGTAGLSEFDFINDINQVLRSKSSGGESNHEDLLNNNSSYLSRQHSLGFVPIPMPSSRTSSYTIIECDQAPASAPAATEKGNDNAKNHVSTRNTPNEPASFSNRKSMR